MIHELELENFQSHKNTQLEFHPHINCIVGESDTGKSTILRGLNWIITNRPAGNGNASYWIRDEKNNLIKDMACKITLDELFIARLKNKDDNKYIIGTEELHAVGMDVPKDINEALNMSSVNIQSQYDNHFMLSSSPGEVARFFNKIIKLDIIDKTFQITESKIRTVKADTKNIVNQLDEIEEQLDELTWLPQAQKYLTKAIKKQETIYTLESKITNLTNLIHINKEWKTKFKKYTFLSQAEELVNKATVSYNKHFELHRSKSTLETVLLHVATYTNRLKEYPDTQAAEKYIEKINKKQKTIEELKTKINTITTLRNTWMDKLEALDHLEYKLDEYVKQLPKICPLCGGQLKDGVSKNIPHCTEPIEGE